MDEIVEILTEDGKETYKRINKTIAHKEGVCHGISAIALIDKDGKLLIQKRSANKKNEPNKWDLSGTGHIDIDETPEQAAVRELFEETGLVADELELFNVYTGEITHYVYFNGDEIYGVDLVYLCNKYHGEIKPQPEEVKHLKFYDLKNMPTKMSIRNKAIVNDLLRKLGYEK